MTVPPPPPPPHDEPPPPPPPHDEPLPHDDSPLRPQGDDHVSDVDDTDPQEGGSVADQHDDPGRRRWVRRLRWPILVLGLLVAGASLGHIVIPRETPFGEAVIIDPTALDEATAGGNQAMPSILGLEIDVARQVLADAGLATVVIETDSRPSAGPAGSVVTQNPQAGTTGVDAIAVTLSSPVLIPDIVGSSLTDARAQLEQIGAVVQVEPIIDPTLPASSVRDVYPPEGSETPSVVKLTVVDVGDALTLADVGTVSSSGCSTVDSAVLGGTSVGSSVSCTPGSARAGYVEYALSRNSTAMDALVGTDDRGGTGNARVRLIGDGRELAAVDTGLGRTTPIRLDTRGVLRLRVEVSGSSGSDAPDVILGDARLMGTPAGLDLIAGQ